MASAGDGIPNYLDLDSDGDGLWDSDERYDLDQDGIPDYIDTVFDQRRLLACRSPICGPQMADDEKLSGGSLFGQLAACIIMLGVLPIWACVAPKIREVGLKHVTCKHCGESLYSCGGGGIDLQLGADYVAGIADLTTLQAEEQLREEMCSALDLFYAQLSVHLHEIEHNRAKFVVNLVRQETAEHLMKQSTDDGSMKPQAENMLAEKAGAGMKYLSNLPDLVQAVIDQLDSDGSRIRSSRLLNMLPCRASV